MPPIIYQNNFTAPAGLKPCRIISLVPSQTELLFDLGLDAEVVGITKFCVYPNKWLRNKVKIGGTKTVDIEKIKKLQPDLILANKEENIKEQVEALAAICPVYVSEVATLNNALQMMQQVSILLQKESKASEMACKIIDAFSGLEKPGKNLATAYLIWRNPYMTAGGDTYISDIMNLCGFENVFVNEIRYPEITIETLQIKNCRLLLLSSEPYPFKEKHIQELQHHFPNTQILLADGEMFSWFGSRLLLVPAYCKVLLQQVMAT